MEGTPAEFSRNGEYFMFSSPDGVLKVWETSTNSLKQEYTPSSHLSSACSCLAWSPGAPAPVSPRKKKKRKSSSGATEAVVDLNLVAVGTTSGSVLLYSVVKGDLHSQLDGGHTGIVNGVCWHTDSTRLYSCSSDHHIVEWDVVSSKVKHKWKGDKSAVHSVCMCSSTHLLSAGRSIKLWDLDTKQLVKVFTGHATEVFRLLHIPVSENDTDCSVENSYFLSAAIGDRLINAWQINTSSKEKNAVASFSLPDEPILLAVSQSSVSERMLVLLVVTRSGQVLIFEHTMNGTLKKPLESKVRVQIATDSGKYPRPVPILAARPEEGRSVILIHGTYLKPTIEKLTYSSAQPDVCLIRDDPMKTSIKTDSSVSKVKTPDVSKDMTVLAPGHMARSNPSQDTSKRRKRKSSTSGEVTMAERLSAINLDNPSSSSAMSGQTAPPTADNLSRLLTQGLQSQDKKILNRVLLNRNETMIRNTVRGLPVQVIIPLVQELAQRMQGQVSSGEILVRWIKAVLTVHTSYLMTFPEILDTFSMLYQMMDCRVTMFGKLSRLQGKLEILLSQIATETPEEEALNSQQPLLQYVEESSDEEALEDMAVAPGYSDEENWEDFSDDSDMEVIEDNDSKG